MKRRLTFLIGSMLSAAALLWALSAGPNNPTWAVSVAGGGADWGTPTNIYASDDARATAVLAASNFSDYLRATDFEFAIPGGATINGIVAGFERSKSGTGVCEDSFVGIVKGGTEVGTDHAVAGAWPAADAYLAYGNATDLWGVAWTPAQINAAGFGVSIAAYESGGANVVTCRVDHVRITVYYTSGRKAFIINVGSLLPAWMPAPFVIADLRMAQTRDGYISGKRWSGAAPAVALQYLEVR